MRQVILCGASAFAISMSLASLTHAQDGTSEEAAVEEIVITGSRIARSDYVAESPIVTVGADAIQARGPATMDVIFNQSPQFSASNANSTSSAARQGRMNANLRGLGIQRTLVLVDGRRVLPADALGAVDMNSISTSLVENIEIITGGASAVYGSDAIAGVVNFKLKRNFTGTEVTGEYGESSRGDGDTKTLSLTMGSNFAEDRGNFIASLSLMNRDLVLRGDRPFFDRSGIASALIGGAVRSNATNLPTPAARTALFVTKYGMTLPSATANYGVNADSTIFSTSAPVVNLRYGDRDPYIVNEGQVGYAQGGTYPIQAPLERKSAFMRGRYNLTENLEVYAQFNHMEYKTFYTKYGWSAGSTAPTAQIPISNPFIPADLRTLMLTRPNPNAPLDFTFSTARLGPADYDFNYDMNEYMVGMQGSVPSFDLTWDGYVSYGKTEATEATSNWVNVAAWRTLVNAADGGASICSGGFNPFSVTPLTAPGNECVYNYLNRDAQETTTLTQVIGELSAQGRLIDLPAGESRFAAGVSYRRMTYDYAPDGQRIRNEIWPSQPTGNSNGSYNVSEGFVEILAPVLKDLPLIQELNLDVAYRYSDYDLAGGVNTYKASVDWKLVDSLRVRASYARAIRAPALAELYAPPERASSTVLQYSQGGGDPCDFRGDLRTASKNPNAAQVRALCLAQGVPSAVIDIFTFAGSAVSGVNAGNVDLQPETADTMSAGVVWRSGFDHPLLSRLSASLDWYDIQVEGAIGDITSAVGLQRCFNSDGLSNPTYDVNNFFCTLTQRNAGTGAIETQNQPKLNLAGYQVSGYDLQTDWSFDLEDIGLGDHGSLAFNLVVSYLDKYKIQNVAGAPFLNYAGTIGNNQIDAGAQSFPTWKLASSLTYSVGLVDLSLRYRWFDSMTHFSDVGAATATRPGVESRQYFDFASTFQVMENTEFRAGVQNIFDQEPPTWTGAGVTDYGLYDLMQRRYYLGVTHKF